MNGIAKHPAPRNALSVLIFFVLVGVLGLSVIPNAQARGLGQEYDAKCWWPAGGTVNNQSTLNLAVYGDKRMPDGSKQFGRWLLRAGQKTSDIDVCDADALTPTTDVGTWFFYGERSSDEVVWFSPPGNKVKCIDNGIHNATGKQYRLMCL